jgi:hypothetical protein
VGISASSHDFTDGLQPEIASGVYTLIRSTHGCGNWLRKIKMPPTLSIAIAVVALTLLGSAQDEVPILKTEAVSALVWGEDIHAGTVSSSVLDPLTGHAIHKLNHGGVEVSSQAGFETIRSGEAGELLNFTATIANNTESELVVRQGAGSVDGRIALPLAVVLTTKGLSKKERTQVWELGRMNCFSSGFLPDSVFLSPKLSSNVSKVTPKSALTVSFVIKDPRYYSELCTVEGCYPKGTIRFSVTVNTTDFVFIWPGKTMVYCGK